MFEYKRDKETNEVYREGDCSWRDLDGGDVLPGFTFYSHKVDISMMSDEERYQFEMECYNDPINKLDNVKCHFCDERFDHQYDYDYHLTADDSKKKKKRECQSSTNK